MKFRLLDLFCGAGGAAMGYHRAGFDVVGVDHRPQPRFPFAFVRADALEYLAVRGREYDVIHASPPCQAYSATRHLPNARGDHQDLVGPMRDLLLATGRPWLIENVPGAPLRPPSVMLCGLSFGLRVFRHRWFESSTLLLVPAHPRHGKRRIGVGGFVCVVGNGGGWLERRRYVPADHRNKTAWSLAMGIGWMTRDELAQSIPPAYTEYLGRQLLRILENGHGRNGD